MSATNRGAERRPHDAYRTPAFCVHRLLELRKWPKDCVWLDPCAGDGAIIDAVNSYYGDQASRIEWGAVEIRPECETVLADKTDWYFMGDFLTRREGVRTLIAPSGEKQPVNRLGIVLMNPPYSLAEEFIRASLDLNPIAVVALLRLNFLASAKRALWLRDAVPDVYVLPNRPSFTGEGTDATDYAWFVFYTQPEREGRVKVLNLTPAEERRGGVTE